MSNRGDGPGRACETFGYPECAINLAHGVAYLSQCKKNRSAYNALRAAQAKNAVIDAELLLKKAFFTDVAPALARWRKANQLPADPLAEHRRSGYERKAAADRNRRRKALGITRGGSFA